MIEAVRSHALIIAPNVITDSLFGISDILIITFWRPFRFKAYKESFSGPLSHDRGQAKHCFARVQGGGLCP